MTTSRRCENIEPLPTGGEARCILFTEVLTFEPDQNGDCQLVDIEQQTAVTSDPLGLCDVSVEDEVDLGPDHCKDTVRHTLVVVELGSVCCGTCDVSVQKVRRPYTIDDPPTVCVVLGVSREFFCSPDLCPDEPILP
ncbi:MAG: hypothetical protein AAGA48_39765 [Myxococcota bacterium]